MTRPTLGLATLLLAATLAAPAALAQPAPLTMPPPPSASDPAPKAERAAKPARKPAGKAAKKRQSDTTFAPSDRSTFSRSEMSDRIDTRGPAGRRMELEDDPRVQPTMQNGRAGVGMRF